MVACALVCSLAACRVPELAGNVPVQLHDYPDVPVPETMVKDREHSMRLETPLVGSVVNVYKDGGLAVGALVDHFEKKMPGLGWRLVSRFQDGSTILVFTKEGRLALLGIGLEQGSPTLSVIVGALGGPEMQPPVQRN